MRIALLTNIISPHQLPLARALVKRVGAESYRYVYTEATHAERTKMGWGASAEDMWCVQGTFDEPLLQETDVVLSGHRALDLFEQRNVAGKKTFYASERWFKPPLGFLRVFAPSYFRMVRRFLRALKAPTMRLLPQGVHAARDFARLMGLFSGDCRCLFRAPKVAFESRPGGVVVPLKQAMAEGVLPAEAIAFAKRHGFAQIPETHWGKVKPVGPYAKMRLWGYFVAPGQGGSPRERSKGPLRVLWVGRMLKLKRVDVLIEAVKSLPNVTLDLHGQGPEEENLRRLAEGCEAIRFHDFVPVEQVRDLMRTHDVYVFGSDGHDGWGAVVSEALEEGMVVVGTIEAGASATMLSQERLYPAGDVAALRRILEALHTEAGGRIGPWTAENAADALLAMAETRGEDDVYS